jgi:hypothetical protein
MGHGMKITDWVALLIGLAGAIAGIGAIPHGPLRRHLIMVCGAFMAAAVAVAIIGTVRKDKPSNAKSTLSATRPTARLGGSTTDDPADSAEPSSSADDVQPSVSSQGSEPTKIVQVIVQSAGDYHRVGTGLYQLRGSPTIDVKYNWYTVTSDGRIDPGDKSCDVSAKVVNVDTRQIVDAQSSATCSFDDGWFGPSLRQGRYKATVVVRLSSGSRGSGNYSFRVVA